MSKLLDLRLNDEITPEQFATKQKESQKERDAVLARLGPLNLAADESVKLAIAAFELSQSLTEKLVAGDYRVKRTILRIFIREGRLNFGKLEC